MGAGIANTVQSIYTPNLQDDWNEFFSKIVTDFVYFGAFAVQAILSESGKKWLFYHQPVAQVRLGQYNEKNIIETAYICTNWAKASRDSIREIKMFGSETPKKGERYLMYFRPFRPEEYYYAVPEYMAAANYIAADGALSEYYNNYIRNNFSANLAIKYPNEPDDDKKQQIYESLQASFGGSKNAGNILLLFGENGTVPEIGSVESVNADLYNSVVDVVKLAIVSANRLTSPILAGISTSSGFSSKSDEIIAATVQYKLTVINKDRQFILDKLNNLLTMNGYDRVLTVEDYNLPREFSGEVEANNDKLNNSIGADDEVQQEVDDSEAENNVSKNMEG